MARGSRYPSLLNSITFLLFLLLSLLFQYPAFSFRYMPEQMNQRVCAVSGAVVMLSYFTGAVHVYTDIRKGIDDLTMLV